MHICLHVDISPSCHEIQQKFGIVLIREAAQLRGAVKDDQPKRHFSVRFDASIEWYFMIFYDIL